MGPGLRVALTAATLACGAACGLTLTGTRGDVAADDAGAGDQGEGSALSPSADATVTEDGSFAQDSSSDATSGVDASKDAADAGGSDGQSPRDAGLDSAPDAATVISCPVGGTVTDCAQCSGYPLLCAMCKTGAVEYICVPKGSGCYDTYRTSGYDWCRCSAGNPAACVLPQQECNSYGGGVCVTCGERQTQGFPCKGGGTCNEGMAKCQ